MDSSSYLGLIYDKSFIMSKSSKAPQGLIGAHPAAPRCAPREDKSTYSAVYKGEKWTRVLVASDTLENQIFEHGVGEDLDSLIIKPKVRARPWRPLY